MRSPSTRARSRSRRCAPRAADAAAIVKDKCKHCKGRGIEVRPRTVKVRVPAGVDDGQRIRVKGRGTPGLNGGPAGDLYVVVHVAPHPIFGRSGKSDLTVKVPITFPEAALGTQVKVPTLDVAGHREGAAGNPERQDRARARARHPARRRVTPARCSSRSTSSCPPSSTTTRARRSRQLAEKLPGNPREYLGV